MQLQNRRVVKGEKRRQSTNLVVSTLLILVLALTASMLLLLAFVIWFADVINSLTLSLAITGITLAAVAWVTYKLTLSPTLKHLREEYEHVIDITKTIRSSYDCITGYIATLLALFR